MPGFEVSSVLSYQGVSLNTPIFPGQGLFLNQLPVGGWLIFGPSKLFKCSSVQEPVKSNKKNSLSLMQEVEEVLYSLLLNCTLGFALF